MELKPHLWNNDDMSKKLDTLSVKYWKLPHSCHIVPKKAVLSAGKYVYIQYKDVFLGIYMIYPSFCLVSLSFIFRKQHLDHLSPVYIFSVNVLGNPSKPKYSIRLQEIDICNCRVAFATVKMITWWHWKHPFVNQSSQCMSHSSIFCNSVTFCI